MRTLILLIVLVAISPLAFSQSAPDWKPYTWLVGHWTGEGGGVPGQTSGGSFTFEPDLQNRVLVRRSFAEYTATKDRPAFRHDDLMIVYRESDAVRAEYFDNEGHVIRYTVTVSPDGKTISFISEASPSAPRYRLTYVSTGKDTLDTAFEIASPGKPDAYKKYVEAHARRVK